MLVVEFLGHLAAAKRVKLRGAESLTIPNNQDLSRPRRGSFWRQLDIWQWHQVRKQHKAFRLKHLRLVKMSLGEMCNPQILTVKITIKREDRVKSLQAAAGTYKTRCSSSLQVILAWSVGSKDALTHLRGISAQWLQQTGYF